MNKKILILLAIILIAILAIAVIAIKQKRAVQNPEITKQELLQKYQTLKTQYEQAKASGVDVSKVERLGKEAKAAYDKGDYKTARELLDKALEILKSEKIPALANKSWPYEGPIYETHPHYYPNHSFKEITAQIPEMKDLGVKTIYMLPIWKHEPPPPKGTPYYYGFVYHVLDYYKISPEFGTEEDLKELINTIHKHNMKIIFDLTSGAAAEESIPYKWVHTISLSKLKEMGLKLEYTTNKGINYVYSNRGEEGVLGGMYKGMFKADFLGRIDGDEVKVFTYPIPGFGLAIDRANPGVIEYFTKAAEYYVKEFDIDGWRIDAPLNNWNPKIIPGDHSSVELLRNAKRAINKIKSDAVFFSESPSIEIPPLGPHSPEELPDPVLDEICEASYSYSLSRNLVTAKTSEQLIDFLTGEKIWHNRARARFVETHDTARINEKAPKLNKPLLVLISTIPGVSMIQAGQEIGATNAYLSDAPVDWAKGDYGLRNFYKKVFGIRNNNNPLKYGTIENVWKSGDNIYAYSRTYENETVIVVINFNGKQVESVLDIPFPNGTRLKDELNGEIFTVSDSANFKITVPAYGSRILTVK
ncbi:MAG: alpha-amylase family glycosyl hydrolase [Patescibacteria group bacterium]